MGSDAPRTPPVLLLEPGALVRRALANWRLITLTTLVTAIAFGAIARSMTPTFVARGLVVPVDSGLSDAGGAGGGQLGGLAALAGISLGASSSKDEYLAHLQSRGFAERFIDHEQLLPHLFPEDWESATKSWRDGTAPTLRQGAERFHRDVMDVTENKKTGIVAVSITCHAPELCARWANALVLRANEELRVRAVREAEANLRFLNAELAKTNVVPLQQALARLVENEVRTAMLARGRMDYAFKVIDAAGIPDRALDKVRPRLALSVVGGAVVGAFVGFFVALVRVRRSGSVHHE